MRSLLPGLFLCFTTLVLASPGRGEEWWMVLDPEATTINFTLDATLHKVEGSGRLTQAEICFDSVSGATAGMIEIDARSLETGNVKRDRVMHRRVLASEVYPDIVFVPRHLEGALESDQEWQAQLHGELRIHETAHATSLAVRGRLEAEELTAEARLSIPYVAWGLEDPSKLLLRVAKEVEVQVELSTTLRPLRASPGEVSCAPRLGDSDEPQAPPE
jgi:polyisoprenoid-binding protein YceI